MNNDSISDEMIARYILGDLSDVETEKFDEMSVADPHFFERIGVVENDLVDRYVGGELNSAEKSRFDDNYLISPIRLEKIQLARYFLRFAENRLNDDAAQPAETQKPIGGIAGFFQSLLSLGNARPFARFALAAASLVFVVIAGLLVFRNAVDNSGIEVVSNVNAGHTESATPFSPSSELLPQGNGHPQVTPVPIPTPSRTDPTPKPSTPLIASFVLTPPVRGGNGQTLTIPAATDRAALRLELESDEFTAYSAELKDAATGRVLWRSDRLAAVGPSTHRSINILVPAKILIPAVYIVSIAGKSKGSSSGEVVGDYPFRVVRERD